VSKETDRVLGHADEADGIEEYDNPLPDWWLGLFWFTIIWAIGYTVHYHFIAHRSQESHFEAEMAAAAEMWPEEEAGSVEFAMTDQAIQAGQEVYDANCYMCHGTGLEGGIGPSFLDDEWIHGGSPQDVIRIITEGVPEKGMLTWGPILGAEKVNQAAAYVLAKNAEALGISREAVMERTDQGGEAEGTEEGGAGGAERG
jgi:cytochrome c oxidase cbb3-type subunit 3